MNFQYFVKKLLNSLKLIGKINLKLKRFIFNKLIKLLKQLKNNYNINTFMIYLNI